MPKYLEGMELIPKPKERDKKVWVGIGVSKKNIFDLSVLIIIPEACTNLWIIPLGFLIFRRETWKERIISSTNIDGLAVSDYRKDKFLLCGQTEQLI